MEGHVRRRWVVIDLVLLALALALVALVVLTLRAGAEAPERTAESARHLAVSEVARQQAVAFLSVDHRDMDTVAEQVLTLASGDFAETYAADLDELVASVRRDRTVVASSARAVGVGELDERRAVVLVAADSEVRGARSEEPTLRRDRLRMELVREDERWLVSELEFVR